MYEYVSITNTEGVMIAILMISRSRGRHIGLLFSSKLIRSLVPLTYLTKPIVIEFKCLSLSQIQKELHGHFNDFTKLRQPYWNSLLEIERRPVSPTTSCYADGHRVQIYVSITNTEGVMVILMIQ